MNKMSRCAFCHVPSEVFQKESPEVFEGFNGFVESLVNTKALDQKKNKHLIYLDIKAAEGDQTVVMFHVPMAKKPGASRDEIKETILLTLTVFGLKGVNPGLAEALDIFNHSKKYFKHTFIQKQISIIFHCIERLKKDALPAGIIPVLDFNQGDKLVLSSTFTA